MKNFKFHVAKVNGLKTKRKKFGWPKSAESAVMEDSKGLTKSATVCGLYKKEILIFF